MAISLPSFSRDVDFAGSVQVIRGQGTGFHQFLRCALGNDLTAEYSCCRPHVDDIVRIEDHIFIMLHHQNGISDIAEVFQGIDQTLIVALMQSNARFIQDVQYIHQLGSNLGSQTDSLGFSSGKGLGAPIER